MNRWIVRILGMVMILALVLLLINLQRKLEMIQQNRRATTATSTSP